MAQITWKWKNISIAALAIILFLASIYQLLLHNFGYSITPLNNCDDSESAEFLTKLCDLYKQGNVAGSHCSLICSDDEETVYHYVRCLHHRTGKIVILIQNASNASLVLKTKRPYLDDYDIPGLRDAFGRFNLVSFSDFYAMVSNAIYFALKTFPDVSGPDLIKRMWSMDEMDSTTGMISLWALMQQEEYIVAKYLQEKSNLTMAVRGTCGHFYAVDYFPYVPFSRHGHSPMEKLAEFDIQVAIQLLEMVKTFQLEFQETLHFCDMKRRNFGVDSNGIVAVIDMDMALFSSELRFQFENMDCEQHSDCTFLDCHGLCQANRRKCSKHRVNNNLQTLCSNILSDELPTILPAEKEAERRQILTVVEKCSLPLQTDVIERILTTECIHISDARVCLKSFSLDDRTSNFGASLEKANELIRSLQNSLC